MIVSFVVLILTLLVSSHRPVRIDTEMTTAPLDKTLPLGKTGLSHSAIFWIGFCVVIAVLARGAAGAAGILAPLSHRSFDLGPVGDVVRSVDRLHRHDLVRPFGLLRPWHVRRRRRAAAGQSAQSLARHPVRARRRRRCGVVRRLFLHPPARHLFCHHHADLQPDLLRHHFHLDRRHRRRERADLHPAASDDPVHLQCALHLDHHALVRARGRHGVLSDPAARHPVAVRHGAAIDPRERAAHPRHRLSGRSATRWCR